MDKLDFYILVGGKEESYHKFKHYISKESIIINSEYIILEIDNYISRVK